MEPIFISISKKENLFPPGVFLLTFSFYINKRKKIEMIANINLQYLWQRET